MSLWKKNEVKVDITSYMHYIRGQKKVGKTTLFNDIIKQLYKGDMENGLLISVGDESGYKTLADLYVAETKEWSDFVNLVDELVENKKDNKFKFIAIDTIDEIFNIATDEVLRLSKIKTGKPVDTLNGAFGGYGAGREKLKELVRGEIARLKDSSYGLFVIGHTKIRNIKEKGTEEEYQQLTTSLNFDLDSVIADKADIIATISIDKEIVDFKDVEIGGKKKQIGSLGGVTRWIHFRDDNFNVDCGARFSDIVDKVELSAENYIEAVENAIKSATGNKSDKEIAKIRKKEIEEREKKAEELLEESKKINENLNVELIETIQSKFTKQSNDVKKKVKELMVQFNIEDFKSPEATLTEGLEKIVEILE